MPKLTALSLLMCGLIANTAIAGPYLTVILKPEKPVVGRPVTVHWSYSCGSKCYKMTFADTKITDDKIVHHYVSKGSPHAICDKVCVAEGGRVGITLKKPGTYHGEILFDDHLAGVYTLKVSGKRKKRSIKRKKHH